MINEHFPKLLETRLTLFISLMLKVHRKAKSKKPISSAAVGLLALELLVAMLASLFPHGLDTRFYSLKVYYTHGLIITKAVSRFAARSSAQGIKLKSMNE